LPTSQKKIAPNFDPIARPYRWMEALTFGRALARCRNHFLPQLANLNSDCNSTIRNALLFGDGDGRFTAALLAASPHLHADAVDLSPAMLRLLTRRAHAAHPTAAARLRTHHADALAFAKNRTSHPAYDLIVTHFFLDCLTQPELDALSRNLAHHAQPQTLWLLSDFRIPTGPMRLPARALVRSLYLAFRLLTGLRITRLPDHAAALTAAGFTRIAQHHSLAGMLTAELWAFTPKAAQPAYTPAMLLPTQRARDAAGPPDPVPNPEPASPSLPEPDPGVFRPDPPAPPQDDRNPACA